jgi:hypothetical protein
MIPVAALSVAKFLIRREVIAVIAIVGLFAMWKRTEAAAFRAGMAEAARVALEAKYDSAVARNTLVVAGLDEALRRNNARFVAVDSQLTVSLDRNATLAARLRQRPTDTVLVKEYVAETEQLREDCASCQEAGRALRDTAALAIAGRDRATASERALRDSLANAPPPPRTSTTTLEKAECVAVGGGAFFVLRELWKLLRR